jgi:hypothetical protein
MAPFREKIIAYAGQIRDVPKPDSGESGADGLVMADIDAQVAKLVNWLLAFAENV